jgi:hypothetical protein
MSDEQPVALKKRKITKATVGQLTCIIHYEKNKNVGEIKSLTQQSFQTIQKSAQIRQSIDVSCHRLDEICAHIPQAFIDSEHGYHRWCYSNFTNVASLVKKLESSTTESTSSACTPDVRISHRNTSSCNTNNVLFPQNDCLFCGKGRKALNRFKYEILSKCVCQSAATNIREYAVKKNDYVLLGKIEGMDLLAREARYHESCRKTYVRNDERIHHRSEDSKQDGEGSSDNVKEQRAAYEAAFQHLCQYVTLNIVNGGSVERMTMLRERYLNSILEHSPKFYNPNHKTDKLKEKLQAHFKDNIQFWRPNNKSSDLVYSSNVNTGEAVEIAFEAVTSESKTLEEAALILRRHINCAHANAEESPWPPSAENLHTLSQSLPGTLLDFLSILISSKKLASASSKVERLTSSIGQDLCSATTNGKWKMPKHMLLATTLRALGGGAKLQTIINRYGHCISHSSSLELETAMGSKVQQMQTSVPTNISVDNNLVCHLCWDNFDINEETPTGSGTTHTTHGIVIQECLSVAHSANVENCTSVIKTKKRSCTFTNPSLPACYTKKRVEPSTSNFRYVHTQDPVNVESGSSLESLWVVSRAIFNKEFSVPGWNGWISKLASTEIESSKSTIGYMSPILNSITDYATVQECLSTSVDVTNLLRAQNNNIFNDFTERN